MPQSFHAGASGSVDVFVTDNDTDVSDRYQRILCGSGELVVFHFYTKSSLPHRRHPPTQRYIAQERHHHCARLDQ